MHGNKRSLFKKMTEVSIHKFIVYKSDKFTKTLKGMRLKKLTVLQKVTSSLRL